MDLARLSIFLREREHEVILVALCLVAVAFSLLNPLWYGEAPGFDASLFALMGKMWAGGEVLYQDMIDIKGPGIFFINMIGYRMGGYSGIAFIETLFLVFGVISLDLALRVFKFTPLSRFCSITTVISLLGLRYYYGNMTEDYALYLAMISGYPYALLFYRRRFSWWLSIIPALTLALTLSIRLNNAAYMIAWDTMLFLFYCANGRLWDGCKLIISALLGIVLVFGGFCAYFISAGGTELLYQAYFYSIGIFFADGAYGTPGLNLLVGTVGFIRTGCFIVLAGFIWLLFSKDNNLINSPNAKYNDRFWFLVYIISGVFMTIVANSVSGHVYDHYDQLFMAFMFIPLAFLMHRYLHVKQDIHISFLTILFLLVYLISERVIFGPWEQREQELSLVFVHAFADMAVAALVCATLFGLRRWYGFYRHNHTFFLCLSIGIALMLGIYAVYLGPHSGRPWDETTQLKVDIVKANTDSQDRIWVEGDMPQYYIWTDKLPASPYLFFSNVNAGRDLKTRVLNGIAFFKPKFVIIRERLVKAFRENEDDNLAYNTSERNFFRYVLKNYTEVIPGLFVLRAEKSKMNLSILGTEKAKAILAEETEDTEVIDTSESQENQVNVDSSEGKALEGNVSEGNANAVQNSQASVSPNASTPESKEKSRDEGMQAPAKANNPSSQAQESNIVSAEPQVKDEPQTASGEIKLKLQDESQKTEVNTATNADGANTSEPVNTSTIEHEGMAPQTEAEELKL